MFIIGVTRGGPAEKDGLQPGDVILAVEDKEISGLADFYRQVWDLGEAGASVRLTIRRGARVLEISVNSANRYDYLNLRPGTGTLAIHQGE